MSNKYSTENREKTPDDRSVNSRLINDNLTKAINKIKSIASKQNNTKSSKTAYANFGFLPTPAMLESYEILVPGFSETFLQMIAAEQKHRHTCEINQISNVRKNKKFGQIVSAVISFFVIYSSVMLSRVDENNSLAITIVIAGFSFLSVSLCLNYLLTKKKENFKSKVASE